VQVQHLLSYVVYKLVTTYLIIGKKVNDKKLTTLKTKRMQTVMARLFHFNLLGNSSDISCVVPGICSKAETCFNCENITIISCDHCSKVAVAFLIIYFVVLGLGILFANLLIISVLLRHRKTGKALKKDYCRGSLAAAQLLTGK